MWPSDIFAQAMKGLPTPDLYWEKEDGCNCGHCGKPIKKGDPYSPIQSSEFFSDTRDLAVRNGICCHACFWLRKKTSMNGLIFTVITPEGIFPISKDINKAWLFLDPPEPPFVAVHTSSKMQHLVWRTPVTLSKELIYMRRGSDLFTIRPAKLRQVMAIAEKVRLARIEAGEKKAPYTIFAVTDRDLRDSGHGRLSPIALKYMTTEDFKVCTKLTPGEVWALTFLLTKTQPAPTRPEPKTLVL